MSRLTEWRKPRKSRRRYTEFERRVQEWEERAQTHREIRRYVAYLTAENTPARKNHPSATTLLIWMRECRRTELYDEGKILFERTQICIEELTEREHVEILEDYQICMRVLSRVKMQKKLEEEKSSNDSDAIR